MVEFVTVTGPAAWASCLVNGDDSGLEPGERAKVDAWLERNRLRQVVCDAPGDDEDSPQEPRFTWSMRVHCPELDCAGGDVLDYIAESFQ